MTDLPQETHETTATHPRRSRHDHAVVYTAMLVTTSAHQPQGTPVTPGKPPTILFMCSHGAAKSVLASGYFQRLAEERGLNVHVISAGTDPDPQVAPVVANHLTKNGYAVPVSKPRRVTDAELSSADVVISIGCDLKVCPRRAER